MGSLTKMIESRLQQAEHIVELARAEKPSVITRIQERGSSPLSAEALGEIIDGLVFELSAANKELASAFGKFEELASGKNLNHRAADDLERVLWSAQGRIAEPYGPEMLQLYGLEESPPAGLRALATFAHNSVTLLRAHTQELVGKFGSVLSTERIADELVPPLDALDDYLASLDDTSAELLAALETRDTVADNWSRTWRGAATVLEGFFLLADRADLATRVRPVLPGLPVEQDHSAFEDLDVEDIERTTEI